MRLMRIGEPGHERPVLVCPEGRHYDLSGITDDIDGPFLAALADNPHLVPAEPVLPEIDITGQRIGAPVARPSALLCIGQNYAAHAAESGAEPPEQPILFYKSPNTVVGPYDDVLIPRGSKKTDWEVELAVVIGRRASYLDSPPTPPRTSRATPSATTSPNAPSSWRSRAASGPRARAAPRSTRWARCW